MPTAPRVLFVDDEPHLLSGLRRGLYGHGVDWQVLFADSGSAALDLMAGEDCDAVVSDMRMPGMDGAQLLGRVQQLYPGTVRIVLSGEAERSAVLAAAASAHQFLSKPCDIDTVAAVVDRALTVRRTLTDPALRNLIGGTTNLPTMPAVYHELTAALARPDCSGETVTRIIDKDVATCVELLKLTNSAFFGIPRQIETVRDAVTMLGLDTIQALVATGTTFRLLGGGDPLQTQQLRHRALRRGVMVRTIGAAEGWAPGRLCSAVLAATLLDIGSLVLAVGRPEAATGLEEALEQDPGLLADPEALTSLERTHFGCTVAQAGAYLLGLWGFSSRVVHLVAGQSTAPADPGAGLEELVLTLAARRSLCPDAPAEQAAAVVAARTHPQTWQSWNAMCDRLLAAEEAEPEMAG